MRRGLAGPSRLPARDPRSRRAHAKGAAMAKSVFYSFHYDNDVHRVQLVRQIDALTGAPEITGQNWEQVRYKTETAIQHWIDKEMNYKKAEDRKSVGQGRGERRGA